MNKADLVALVSQENALSKPHTLTLVNSIFKHISDALAKKETFQLVGFGTFTTGIRKSRVGRNPLTGEVLNIPASVSIKFKVSKALKERVNE